MMMVSICIKLQFVVRNWEGPLPDELQAADTFHNQLQYAMKSVQIIL